MANKKVESHKVYTSSNFYFQCLKTFPQISTEILLGLSCIGHLTLQLWYFLSQVVGLNVKEYVQAVVTNTLDGKCNALMLFSKIFQYEIRYKFIYTAIIPFLYISMLDDDPKQTYFSLLELHNITKFLDEVVFCCLWDCMMVVRKSHFLECCVRLLDQLIKFNSKRSFIHVKDLSVRCEFVCKPCVCPHAIC